MQEEQSEQATVRDWANNKVCSLGSTAYTYINVLHLFIKPPLQLLLNVLFD